MQLECWYGELYNRVPGAGVHKFIPEIQCISTDPLTQKIKEASVDSIDALTLLGVFFGLVLVIVFTSWGPTDNGED